MEEWNLKIIKDQPFVKLHKLKYANSDPDNSDDPHQTNTINKPSNKLNEKPLTKIKPTIRQKVKNTPTISPQLDPPSLSLNQANKQRISYPCHICNKTYKTPTNLNEHFHTQHSKPEALPTTQPTTTPFPTIQNGLLPLTKPTEEFLQEGKKIIEREAATIENKTQQAKTASCLLCQAKYQNLPKLVNHITKFHKITVTSEILLFSGQETINNPNPTLPRTKRPKPICAVQYPPDLPNPIDCPLCRDSTGTVYEPYRDVKYDSNTDLQIHLLTLHPNSFASKHLLSQTSELINSPNKPPQIKRSVHFKNLDSIEIESQLRCLCKMCNRVMRNPKILLRHQKRKHMNFLYPYRHAVLDHQATSLYKCNICKEKYHSLKQLSIHIKQHETKWESRCRKCDRRFQNNRQKCTQCTLPLRTSKKIPTMNLYECQLCTLTTHNPVSLQLHITNAHRHQWEVFQQNKSMLQTISPFQCAGCTEDNSIDPEEQAIHLAKCPILI